MPFLSHRILVKVVFLALPLLFLSANAQTDNWVESYDNLLKKYVKANGVDYKRWHASVADRRALCDVVSAIATTDVSKSDSGERLAFYLNAYNAWILHVVVEAYPVKSIKKAKFLVFRRNHITVAGKKTSFMALENNLLRKEFAEPRMHFALNCASRACPPLQARAFRTRTLKQDLQNLARAFMNDPNFGVSRKGKHVYLSKIFDWYASDFGGKSALVRYINGFRSDTIPKETKVRFMDYDWSLNTASK